MKTYRLEILCTDNKWRYVFCRARNGGYAGVIAIRPDGTETDMHEDESSLAQRVLAVLRLAHVTDTPNQLARCEDAMKQARWAIALQLSRWRDGDSVCAVGELQNAYDALADLVGDAKPMERELNRLERDLTRENPPQANQTWGDEPTNLP